jgi:hypothetical protein
MLAAHLSERIKRLEPHLEELLACPILEIERRNFPQVPGVYRILSRSEPGATVRAGRSDVSLRQRLYTNHLIGDQSGNLPAQLVGGGECADRDAAKRSPSGTTRRLPERLHGKETHGWGDQVYRGQRAVIRDHARKARDFTNCHYRHRGVVDEVERPKNRTKSKVRARVAAPSGVMRLNQAGKLCSRSNTATTRRNFPEPWPVSKSPCSPSLPPPLVRTFFSVFPISFRRTRQPRALPLSWS